MTKLLAPPALILLSIGCRAVQPTDTVGPCDTAEGASCADGDDESGLPASFTFTEGFYATGYAIELHGPPPETTGFRLGFAHTTIDDPSDAWYGEDCLQGSGDVLVCHEFTGTTGSLTTVDDYTAVESGLTTLFHGNSAGGFGAAYDRSGDDNLTYYVEFLPGGTCFVFGDDPSYYATLGCSVVF